MHRRRAAAAIALVLGALAASPPPPVDAAATVSAGAVDAAIAVRAISDYRAAHGLGAVKVEARLMKIAAVHSQRMAERDTLDHVLPGEGSFMQRVKAGGYDPSIAAEDIGAGYRTFADALAGWEKSPPHNANLLDRNVTEIGIAVYTTTAGSYHQYWSLVLAKPMPPPPPPGSVVIGPFGIPLN